MTFLKDLHPGLMVMIWLASITLSGGTAASDQFSPQTPLLWSYDVENLNEEIECVAISDDGNYIIIGTWSWDEGGVYLFGKNSNTWMWKYPVDGGVTSVGISSDGSYLVASGFSLPNPVIYVFDRSSSVTPLWSYSPEFNVGSIAISGDGNYIAAAESGGSLGETRKLYLFHKSSPTPLWTADLAAGGGANISISDDGNLIVVGGTKLYLFDKSTNNPLWTFQPSGSIVNVSNSADGSYIAVGTIGETPNVYLFHKSSNTPIWNYETSATVSMSSDGNYVTAASSSYAGGPRGFVAWHKNNNIPLWIYPTAEAPTDISISNSGNRIAGVESGAVYLFSKDTSKPVWNYGSAFERASIAGDGNFIAASERHRLTLFDTSFEVPSEVWVDDDYCETCSNDGHTWGYNAFPSIQVAVDALWTGGTIHVASGTYSETAVYRGGGYEYTAVFITRDNVKLLGEGMDTTIIDSDQEANRVIITGQGCEVKGFTIKNSGWGYRGIYLMGSGSHAMSGNTILNNGTGIELSRAGDSVVENSIITYNDTGISNQDSHGNVFSSNVIAHNERGITSHSNNTVIKNCVIAQNGSGIRTEYTSGDVFVNNTVADNDIGIYMFTCFSSITNSVIWGNENELNVSAGDYSVTHCNVEGGWPGTGNTSLLPAFVDGADGDYHLQEYSSCIGIGKPAGAPDTDIEGNQRPNPPGSNPDVGAYEHMLAIPEVPPVTVLNVFGLELGNKWVYERTNQGTPYSVEREITGLDQTTFSAPVSVMGIKENGVYAGVEFYEDTGDHLKFWGTTIEYEGTYYNLQFSNGLPVAWFPAAVDEHEFSSTDAVIAEFPEYPFNVSLDVLVIGKESVTLGFDTLEAYKIHYQMRVWGQGIDETEMFTRWVVPHIGVIKDESSDSVVELTSFAIGGGAITEASDADSDGLTDYQELFKYKSHWQYPDTDADSCEDGAEVMGGRNPLVSDPQGDLNMDCALDLKDAVDALRVVELMHGSSIPDTKGDVNGDGQIGLEDASFVIEKICGLR